MTVVWTQWPDLKLPAGVTHLPTDGIAPAAGDLNKVEFYVPRYMGGPAAIAMIPDMKGLKVIQSPNAGVDDVLKIRPDGVTLCNAAGVHDASTAELAVALSIASRRGFANFAADQVVQRWAHERVTSFSRSGKDGALTFDHFDRLLPTFDVIILIVPLNDQTRHLMNAQRLAAMKNGAALINVARGPVVDTDALIAELNSGRITAGLDVTDPEPLPSDHPLWKARNVIITPHVGGDSEAFTPRGRKLVEEQLVRYASGQPLLHIVAQ